MPARTAILIVADDRQFPPAAFLASRLASLNPDPAGIEIALATNSVADLQKARTAALPCRLIDASRFLENERLPHVIHLTRATYFALLAPTLLGNRIERILYLDVDTYPVSDKLFRLLDLDLKGFAVCAVRDLQVPFRRNPTNGAELVETLRIAPEDRLGAKYLNSGVLLIDAGAYRRDRIEKQVLRIYRDGRPLRFIDQSALNMVLRGRWLELSPAFNMVMNDYLHVARTAFAPEVMHFTGPLKPWHTVRDDAKAVHAELRAFLADTAWSGFLLEVNAALFRAGPLVHHVDPPLDGEFLDAFLRYLTATPFADVDQGLTPRPMIESAGV